jgi:hypothetical protein
MRGIFPGEHCVVWEAIDEELDRMPEEKRKNFYTDVGLKNLSETLGFPVKIE